jgi:hypothetical protein
MTPAADMPRRTFSEEAADEDLTAGAPDVVADPARLMVSESSELIVRGRLTSCRSRRTRTSLDSARLSGRSRARARAGHGSGTSANRCGGRSTGAWGDISASVGGGGGYGSSRGSACRLTLLIGQVLSGSTVSLNAVVDTADGWVWNADWVDDACISACWVVGVAFRSKELAVRSWTMDLEILTGC